MQSYQKLPAASVQAPHSDPLQVPSCGVLNRRPGQVVLDIGGSKECPFLPCINAPRKHLIIALPGGAAP